MYLINMYKVCIHTGTRRAARARRPHQLQKWPRQTSRAQRHTGRSAKAVRGCCVADSQPILLRRECSPLEVLHFRLAVFMNTLSNLGARGTLFKNHDLENNFLPEKCVRTSNTMPPRNIKNGGGGGGNMTLDARFTQMAASTNVNRQVDVAQRYVVRVVRTVGSDFGIPASSSPPLLLGDCVCVCI